MGEPMYQKRKIVAWLYRSNNSTWGYDAVLECGHKRTDLSAQFGGHRGRVTEALCWQCVTGGGSGAGVRSNGDSSGLALHWLHSGDMRQTTTSYKPTTNEVGK